MKRPNFLFLFPDQWRWDWIGAEGRVPVHTPHLNALAKRGLRFTNARTCSPLCGPSRACLATARHFHRAGVMDNRDELDPALPNMFQALKAAGYAVMTCGKSDLHTASECFDDSGWHPHLGRLGFTDGIDFPGKWRGINRIRNKLPDAYSAFLRQRGLIETYIQDMLERDQQRRTEPVRRHSTRPSPLPEDATADAFCGLSGLALLKRCPPDQPWLLWVNFPGPHEPFDPPASRVSKFAGTVFPDPICPGSSAGEDHQGIRQNYAAMIAHIDDWIGQLCAAVEQRGETENTWIIFASDHGEMLGDHGRWYKQSPREASVRIPLIVSAPHQTRPTTCHALVEQIDINPTILDLAGLPALPHSDGHSLCPILQGQQDSLRQYACSALRDWRMVTDGRYKLIQYTNGEQILWDLESDPQELNNLSSNPEYAPIVNRLQGLLPPSP